MKIKVTNALLFFFLITSFASPSLASDYGDLLKRLVTENGVKLDRWGKKENSLFEKAKKTFQGQDPMALKSKEEGLAFWINAHNFCVVNLLREKWPVSDVMGINGFRDQLKCSIAGSERTLYEMDSGIIRVRFKDSRTRFALWWGTKGGAPLAETPYPSKGLYPFLDKQVKSSLSGNRLVWITEESKTLRLSPIFEWYRGDFGKSDQEVVNFLRKNLGEERTKMLPEKYSEVQFGSFDWHIDLPGPPAEEN